MITRKPRCRTGCLTCRARKIKCDETKPFCTKCVSTGRTCDGYSKPSSPETPRPPVNARKESISTPPLSIEAPNELRALGFFRVRTAQALSSTFESDYWTATLLRLASFDPMIRNSVIALSSIHYGFELSSQPLAQRTQLPLARRQALLHYIKTVNQMQQCLSDLDSKAATLLLVTSVSLICLELLQDNYLAAISHFEGGLQILTTFFQSRNHDCVPSLFDTLEDITIRPFYQLVTQTLYVQVIGIDTSLLPKRSLRPVPPTFDSVRQAKDHLDLRSLSSYHLFRDLRTPSPPKGSLDLRPVMYHEEIAELSNWRRAFSELLSELGPYATTKEFLGIELLNIQYLCLETMLQLAYQAHLGASEVPIGSFHRILILVQSLLERPPGKCLLPKYSFDVGVIGPLFFTAVHAPSIKLRLKALGLLRHPNIPYREGLFSSAMTAAIAERITTLQIEVIHNVTSDGDTAEVYVERKLPTTWFKMNDLIDDAKRMKVKVGRKDIGSMLDTVKEGTVTWDTWGK